MSRFENNTNSESTKSRLFWVFPFFYNLFRYYLKINDSIQITSYVVWQHYQPLTTFFNFASKYWTRLIILSLVLNSVYGMSSTEYPCCFNNLMARDDIPFGSFTVPWHKSWKSSTTKAMLSQRSTKQNEFKMK